MKIKILLWCILLVSGTLLAQYDPQAKEILQSLSQKYENMDAFSADFKRKINMKGNSDFNESMSGKITVMGDNFRIKMDDGIEVIKHDNTMWTYIADEVNITNYEPAEEEININNIFSLYEEGYKYTYVGEEKSNGNVYEVVDLIPENRNLYFYRIRMRIDKDKNQLKSFSVFDRENTEYVYEITDFDPSVEVSEDYFIFDKKEYPNVRVEDLRDF